MICILSSAAQLRRAARSSQRQGAPSCSGQPPAPALPPTKYVCKLPSTHDGWISLTWAPHLTAMNLSTALSVLVRGDCCANSAAVHACSRRVVTCCCLVCRDTTIRLRAWTSSANSTAGTRLGAAATSRTRTHTAGRQTLSEPIAQRSCQSDELWCRRITFPTLSASAGTTSRFRSV